MKTKGTNTGTTFLGALFLVMVLLQCAAAQTVHVVGDNIGWSIPQGGANAFVTWAASKTFVVGDILEFNFQTNEHDVLQVSKASFDACTSDNPIRPVIMNGPANVTLETSGDHYYICTIGRHCSSGQKLSLTVSSATTPGASPSPATTTPTPPSNNTVPADCVPEPSPSPPTTTTPPPDYSSSCTAIASLLLSAVCILAVWFA